LVRLHGSTPSCVVDVTVTSARTNTNVPHADLCTSALLRTPSVSLVRDYCPFAMEDGGRLAPMPVKLVDRLAILVAFRRFLGMGANDSRSLRSDTYVPMQHLFRRTTYVPFRRFVGDVRRELMQRLSVALHGTLGSYPRDASQEGSADAVACLPVIPRA
jgi:hypothetical protein